MHTLMRTRSLALVALGLGPVVGAAGGCAGVGGERAEVGRAAASLTACPEPPGEYRLGCPDVIACQFAGEPNLDCAAVIDLDGTVTLPAAPGAPQGIAVAGLTVAEARAALARAAGRSPDSVEVTLAEARASRLTVIGPANRVRRTVSYHGPESVAAFLARSGAVQPGCSELRDITVVRPNVASGGAPESVRVDLAAILVRGEQATNVTLEPSDIVVVGETRRSRFARMLPEWAAPAFERLSGVRRGG